MLIKLVAINKDLFMAWQQAFSGCKEIEILEGDILTYTADAIVSPANSFGFMDGGIDLAYSYFFGWELEQRLKKILAEKYYGELPVGQAAIVATNHKSIPFLISAPTMRVPASIQNTINVYLAFRAALIAAIEHNKSNEHKINSVLVPGLGTGIGQVTSAQAAKQMRCAYDAIMTSDLKKLPNARMVLSEHYGMLE